MNFQNQIRKPQLSAIELTSEYMSIDSGYQLFSKIERSIYNRRKRNLFYHKDQPRKKLVSQISSHDYYIVDSMPLEICKLSRSLRSNICKEDYSTAPDKGSCASQKSHYYGYKLHAVCTVKGVFTDVDLTQASVHDIHIGKEGYTLAAALLFGKENTLASVLPHYKTDALCRKVDTERYDDRDDIRCNLMCAYSRLIAFAQKHLPDRFYLEGTQRISIRDIIIREVVANLLVHREFSNAYPATLTIYKDTLVTENWNRPYMMGRISLENLKPHPKNPAIANFFQQLGWVEELGSGVRKMYKYCPIYVDGALPDIEEGDVFKLTIQHEPIEVPSDGVNDGVSKEEALAFDVIKQTEGLNANAVAERIGKSVPYY